MSRQELMEQIANYIPYNEQEEMDQPLILNWIKGAGDSIVKRK